ncbi:MAG: anti-sigma factor [Gemmatales bacterium]
MKSDAFPLEHLHALLADRALQGADAAEEAGINCLLQHYPELDAESFDRAAAALDLALSGASEEPIPAALMNRLEVQAAAFGIAPLSPDPEKIVEPAPSPTATPSPRASAGILAWTGWLVAAVVFLFAVLPSTAGKLTVNQLRDRGALVAQGKPGPQGTPNLSGEFIFDKATQQGFMKLTGFPVNDPKKSQYQLWIFDEKKFTKETPIDGGVFDVNKSGEVLIPITPNIKVGDPALFAITVEEPGGVMQSKREKLIFVGPVEASR